MFLIPDVKLWRPDRNAMCRNAQTVYDTDKNLEHGQCFKSNAYHTIRISQKNRMPYCQNNFL